MRRPAAFLPILLTGLAALCGYLLSQPSFAGRAGITLFYRQYRFLKTGWQGGLLILIIYFLLYGLLYWAKRKQSAKTFRILAVILLITGLAGLYFTYLDFTGNFSHRILGSRFHWGGYLFWAGWLLIPVTLLATSKKTIHEEERGHPAV